MHYQLVTLSPEVRVLLEIYDVMRPILQKKRTSTFNRKDKYFLGFTGQELTQIGKYITAYFKPFDLYITSTTIRALADTLYDELFSQGVITESEKIAGQLITGHRNTTAEMFYIKRDRCDTLKLKLTWSIL
jgi:hypothetical protein